MAIAEVFIGAFITVLFEKLASSDVIKLAQSAGIDSELNKLRKKLELIQAVLVDAEEKQIKVTSVQTWLNELKHLAYEIDDVLDDLATEAMRRKLNQESLANTSTRKISKFIPTKLHALKYGRKMSSKLDEITTKLHALVEEKNLLGLSNNAESSKRVTSRQREETSLVDESKVIGREGDREALLRKLLGGESSSSQTQNVDVVSIVGMGGIGKTTLAQLLYNDEKVKDHFELSVWVCVSDEFDVLNITKAICQAVGVGNQDSANLNLLQESLKEKLSKKRFLLVLDDVWNEKYSGWELLQRPFTEGASGSKVLVTTRKTTVASVMDSVQTYPLELLSDEEALSLFAQHASGKQNFDVNKALKLHGERIINKCARLPLALRILGRVFRTKSSFEEWEELLNSEIWNLDKGNEILPALRLSYYDLPPHLKQIFAYCCLFPKDYIFDKDEIILLWMAEGLLDKRNGDKPLENLGGEYFEELVFRSFFQHSTKFNSQYAMHDLISDLATSVGEEFFFLLDDKIDVYNEHESLEKARHLSFIRERYGAYKKFKALQRARHVRTFLATSVDQLYDRQRFYVSNKVLTELLPQMKFLRVLSLAYYNITEVPHSIGNLKHMRYLNLSNTPIKCLPEQVGDLVNLQSLLLSRCDRLSTLPNSTLKLINLRHLDIANTSSLETMPSGLDGLACLQTLSRFIIGGAGECRISDLKGLLHLRGQLSVEGLQNVKDAFHAKEANLQLKEGICDLKMKWSDVFDNSRNEKTEYEVLEGLRPFEKLTSLEIAYYMGTKFPSWVGDSSFVWLTQLALRGCRRCTCLPTLGHLPSLEILEFKDMESWEEWSTSGGDKDGLFPCLREMSIINCPKLDVTAMELIPSLQVLHVEGCSLAVLRSMVGVSSSIVRLTMNNIKGLTQLHGKVLEHLKAVEDLRISKCDELVNLWESEAAAYAILVNLKRLELTGCENLVSLGEKEADLVINIESFIEVIIEDCPRLESYKCPNSIEKLRIEGCASLTSLTYPTMDDLPSTLKRLEIRRCDNVEVNWLLMPSLEYLSIWPMRNLRLFPEGCLAHLTRLEIWGCDKIESIPNNGYGFLPCLCLRYLRIFNCKNLKSFPHEQLQSLTSLKRMEIRKCPSLDESFPCGLWPPNLSDLFIGGLKKPISEWGLQNFPTSLDLLYLFGDENKYGLYESGVVSFANFTFLLPSSLTFLRITKFKELESLSDGLQHLTSLQHLHITSCPKLRDLPETLLPSLSSLSLRNCYSRELRKKCRRSRKGKYWPTLSRVPRLDLPWE
ncbi:putative disease resistance RPP13-like protein 1 [Bidens hawaiensis]|uniref:putative disease resistance RPP13-like protein 1 n=1 Tax=Bidens hawaiensis TaxID=980011 RepID=UPI004049EE76